MAVPPMPIHTSTRRSAWEDGVDDCGELEADEWDVRSAAILALGQRQSLQNISLLVCANGWLPGTSPQSLGNLGLWRSSIEIQSWIWACASEKDLAP